MDKEIYYPSKIAAYIGEVGGITAIAWAENTGMFLCGAGAYIIGRCWNKHLNKNNPKRDNKLENL